MYVFLRTPLYSIQLLAVLFNHVSGLAQDLSELLKGCIPQINCTPKVFWKFGYFQFTPALLLFGRISQSC